MEQREVDNMLLSMIQKHFPSLPLSDEHTDWGKWLGFARAVYEAGRASPASVPEGFKHDIGAERFAVVRGSYWWHVRAGNGTQNIGKFHTELSAKEMALTLLTAFRDGAFMQYQADLAAAPTPPVSEDRWLPIETAPKDKFVLLAGPSGYTTIEIVYATGRMCSDYHVGRWIDHANDDLTDWGFEPTHWMPLPKAPAMQEDKP